MYRVAEIAKNSITRTYNYILLFYSSFLVLRSSRNLSKSSRLTRYALLPTLYATSSFRRIHPCTVSIPRVEKVMESLKHLDVKGSISCSQCTTKISGELLLEKINDKHLARRYAEPVEFYAETNPIGTSFLAPL